MKSGAYKFWTRCLTFAGLAGILLIGASADSLFAQAAKPAEPAFFQPHPLYENARPNGWPAAIPNVDTNSYPCTTGTVKSAPYNYDSHCNDYFLAYDQGPMLSGIQNTNPHQIIMRPMMYWPLCPLDVYIDAGEGMAGDKFGLGWLFDGKYSYSGCWGLYDAITAPYVDRTNNPENYLLSNTVADAYGDGTDSVSPFFDADNAHNPVSLAFENDKIIPEGEGLLPISTTTGYFVRKNIMDMAAGDVSIKLGSMFDVATLLRGADGNSEGYVSFLHHTGLKESYTCHQTAFDPCGSPCKDDPYENAAACQACISGDATKAQQVSDNLEACTKTYEYGSDAAYKDIMLEGTKNPVFILGLPLSSGVRRDANGELAPVGHIKVPPFDGRLAIGVKVGEAAPAPAEEVGPPAEEAGDEAPAEAADEVAAPAAGNVGNIKDFVARKLNIPPRFFVADRFGMDCFGRDSSGGTETRFIRYRNPTINAVGDIIDTANDADAIPDLEDTQGIVAYKTDGAPAINLNTTLPAPPETKRCGSLIFYTTGKDGAGNPTVNPVKKDNKIYRIPVGYNPVMCEYGHDLTGDTGPDIICTNAGSPTENIAGSITVVSCPMNAKQHPDPTGDDPYYSLDDAGNIKHDPLCQKGWVVHDFPIKADAPVYHPWWLTTAVMKGKKSLNPSPDKGDQLKKAFENAARNPEDFAVTYLDAYQSGSFSVHLSQSDGVAPAKKFANDPSFDVNYIDTEPLSTIGAPPLVEPIVTGKANFPLGITSGHFGNVSYEGKGALGANAIMNDFYAHEFIYGGYQVTIDPDDNEVTPCVDLVIGFNNGRKSCVFRNLTEETGTHNVKKCTGKFAMPDKRIDCSDTSTTVYNQTTDDNGNGNWGDKYIAPTRLDLLQFQIPDKSNEKIWSYMFRLPISINTATERSYKTDLLGNNFMPRFYHGGPEIDGRVFDIQIDVSPDQAALNGPINYLPDQRVFGPNGVTELQTSHPHVDACVTPSYEMAAMITDTKNFGKADLEGGLVENGTWWTGDDTPAKHRCYQRHMMQGVDITADTYYGTVPAACCLMLEEPASPDYVGWDKILATKEAQCPGADPMTCCVKQNLFPFNPTPVTIDWNTLDVNGATYVGEDAAACDCEGDLLVKYNAVLAQLAAADCVANPVLCQTLTNDLLSLQQDLCECNPVFPWCDDDDPDCSAIADPQVQDCCEDWVAAHPGEDIWPGFVIALAAGETACTPPDGDGDPCEDPWGNPIPNVPLPFYDCCMSGNWDACDPGDDDGPCEGLPQPWKDCCLANDWSACEGDGGGDPGGGDEFCAEWMQQNITGDDNDCNIQCCIQIINNGGTLDLSGADICTCNDPGGLCEQFPNAPECQPPTPDDSPAPLSDLCEGVLELVPDKPEKPRKIDGKEVVTFYRASNADFKINLGANNGQLLKTLKIVGPEENAMSALASFEPNVTIEQVMGTMPEITVKQGPDTVGISSVKDTPITSPSTILTGKFQAAEPNVLRMTWSLACEKDDPKEYCKHDEPHEWKALITANGQTAECKLQAMRAGGLHGGACSLNRASSVTETSPWAAAMLFLVGLPLMLLRRRFVRNR